jgi:hypothetical protein
MARNMRPERAGASGGSPANESPRAVRRVALPLDAQETEPAESTKGLVPGPQRESEK